MECRSKLLILKTKLHLKAAILLQLVLGRWRVRTSPSCSPTGGRASSWSTSSTRARWSSWASKRGPTASIRWAGEKFFAVVVASLSLVGFSQPLSSLSILILRLADTWLVMCIFLTNDKMHMAKKNSKIAKKLESRNLLIRIELSSRKQISTLHYVSHFLYNLCS